MPGSHYISPPPEAVAAPRQSKGEFRTLDQPSLDNLRKIFNEMKDCDKTPMFRRALVHLHKIVGDRIKELRGKDRPHLYFPTGFEAPIKWGMADASSGKSDEGILLVCQVLDVFGMQEFKAGSKDYMHWKRCSDDVPIMVCRDDIAKFVKDLRAVIDAF